MGRHSHASTTISPTRPRRAIGLAMVAASIAGAAFGVAATAAAASPAANRPTAHPAASVHRGVGVVIAHGTDFVGQYRVVLGGRAAVVYCIDPTKRQPAHLALSTVGRVPGLSTTASREVAQVLGAHGQTNRLEQAEATSQAVNYLAGNRADVARRARYLARPTQRLAMSYVAQARRLRGGVRVALHLSSAALPGQSGHGTIAVTGPGGGQAVTVTLTHSANVATPTTVRTNGRGAASFGYTTTGGGQVRVAATATDLAPVTVRVSSPAPGDQRMVSASPLGSARASATYQGRVTGFGNSYACSSECQGHPVVTLHACAAASTYAARLTYAWADGSATIDIPAGARRTCRSVGVTVADGARVTAAWRYRTADGWTAPMPASGTFVVDCPAAPTVAVVTSYDCSAGSLTAVLGRQVDGAIVAARNTTRHRMVLVMTGALTDRVPLAPGATATARTWSFTCGQHSQITVRGGVQRTGGQWNYGHPVTITTP